MFIIEAKNAKGDTGFLMETKQGVMFSNKLTSDVKIFDTWFKARTFGNRNKLDKRGNSFKIKAFSKLKIEDGVVAAQKSMCCIARYEDEAPVEFVHYNTLSETYYTQKLMAGCCVWIDAKSAVKFMEETNDTFEGFLVSEIVSQSEKVKPIVKNGKEV
jgi:hypothetical protein